MVLKAMYLQTHDPAQCERIRMNPTECDQVRPNCVNGLPTEKLQGTVGKTPITPRVPIKRDRCPSIPSAALQMWAARPCLSIYKNQIACSSLSQIFLPASAHFYRIEAVLC